MSSLRTRDVNIILKNSDYHVFAHVFILVAYYKRKKNVRREHTGDAEK